VYVRAEGHCREFKVIQHNGNTDTFSIQRDTAAVVLTTQINRQLTTFYDFDITANCSSSSTANTSTVIQTQVLTS